MGTIYIEEYSATGSAANRDLNISDLSTLLTTTKDATTSSSAENIILDDNTRQVSIYAVEAHRVVLKSDTTATKYAFVPAGSWRDFGVIPGETLYYELDA